MRRPIYISSSSIPKMDRNFLRRIKPLLRICRGLGLTYITYDKSRYRISYIINVLIRIWLVSVHINSIYDYVISLSKNSESSQIMKIGEMVELNASALCVTFKWYYYFVKRKQVEEIINKVGS